MFGAQLAEIRMLQLSNIVAAALVLQVQGALADDGARQLVLTNQSRAPIVEIYVSDDGAGDFHEDRLGAEFLLPGGAAAVRIDDRNGNCLVDIKVVFDSGATHINRRVEACPLDRETIPVR
jgi:hypothetical protein